MIYRRDDVQQLSFSCSYDEVQHEPLVLTIDAFVEGLDLEPLDARFSEAGTGYYDPGMLLKVWFFAYCDRSYHCRRVAERIRFDVRYRYFVGRHRPDFRTLNRFRKDHLDLMAGYFAALVRHCEEQGLIDSSVMALDGSKIRANTSRRKRRHGPLTQAIRRRLEEDAQSDEPEDTEPVPGDAAEAALPSPVRSVRAADPEARLMKTGEGTVRPCYNAQVVVDNHQLIVAADVGTNEDDHVAFAPMVDQAEERLSAPLGAITMDGGYYSGRNLKYAQAGHRDIYIPKGRDSNKVIGQEAFVYDNVHDRFRCPHDQWLRRGTQHRRNGVVITQYRSTVVQCRGCPLKEQCTKTRYRTLRIAETYDYERTLAAKMRSPQGQATYARRQELVEPVFGNIKFNLGFVRFSLRGLTKTKGEFLLVCIAHNLKKLARWRDPRPGHTAPLTNRWSIVPFVTRMMAILQTLSDPKNTIPMEYARA
jgi:transposase